MKKFTTEFKVYAAKELSQGVEALVSTIKGIDGVKDYLESQLTIASLTRLQMVLECSILGDIPTMIPEKDYGDNIKLLSDTERAIAWKYRNMDIRSILLKSILSNKKSIPFLVKDVLQVVLHNCILQGSNNIVIGQVIHGMKLQSKTFSLRSGEVLPATPWIVDQMRLQLVSELSEIGLLDFKPFAKTHVVSLVDNISNTFDKSTINSLAELAQVVQSNTILLDKPTRAKQLISRSSWFYDTPELCAADIEFNEIHNGIKWEFVDNASDLIEEAFKSHLKVDILTDSAKARVAFYKEQIDASHANGGHYILSKDDSARRRYAQADIGHNQTSSFIRDLVKPVGVLNPVKYDMTNNVVQMYALALKSKSLAKYVNLLNFAECDEDLRLLIAKYMNRELGVTVFTKDNIKPLFMVWAYNGGKARLLDGVNTESINFFTKEIEIKIKTEGLRSLVDGAVSDDTIWSTWNAVLNTLVPEIVELKKLVSRVIAANPFTHTSWTLPDDVIAQYASVEVHSEVLSWISSKGNKHVHTHYRKELVANAKAAGLLPRWIHSIDAYIMRQLVIRCHSLDIIIVPNHDSFIFDECHTDVVFDLVRQLLIEVMEGNVFYSIIKSFNVAGVSETGSYDPANKLTAADLLQSTPMKPE